MINILIIFFTQYLKGEKMIFGQLFQANCPKEKGSSPKEETKK